MLKTSNSFVIGSLIQLSFCQITDVEQGFMPYLMDMVCDEIRKSDLGRLVLDGMIREIVAARSQAYQVKKSYASRISV